MSPASFQLIIPTSEWPADRHLRPSGQWVRGNFEILLHLNLSW
jgi:hypothetical protein